jgi:hypothetical protein
MAKVVQVKVVPEAKVTELAFVAVPFLVRTVHEKAPETVWAVPFRLKEVPL